MVYHGPTEGPLPVVGFEYVRSMAEEIISHAKGASRSSPLLCVGLGALPAYLDVRMREEGRGPVQCVEIDETVLQAAREALGLRFHGNKWAGQSSPEGPQVSHGDAAALLQTMASRGLAKGKAFCCIALDAYDGEGLVPEHLQAAQFLQDVCRCLAPGGLVICNLFNGARNTAAGHRLEVFVGRLKTALGSGGSVTRRIVEGQEMNVVIQGYKAH